MYYVTLQLPTDFPETIGEGEVGRFTLTLCYRLLRVSYIIFFPG